MKTAVKVLSFKYLRRQRILTLALILYMSSMLFSITAFSLLGFYRGFNVYLGEGEDVVVLYGTSSRTPFTGLVPAYLTYKIGALNGVLASSPEVIAPCIVNGKAVFLRGVLPDDFLKLNQLTIVSGSPLSLNDLNSMIVGIGAAEKLRLKLNDRVLILGVLADRYVELHVKGIYECSPTMDDEIIAPLYIGQWLRGMGYDYVTLIRFRIDRSVIAPSEIFEAIAEEASQPSQQSQSQEQPTPQKDILPRWITRFRLEDLAVEEAGEFMRSYMERYGITREALLTLSVAIFFFSGATVVIAIKTIIVQHKGEISVLRSLGASRKLLKRDILLKLLPWSMISSAFGVISAIAILALIQGYGHLQVLSHTVPLQLDPLIIALNFSLTIMLVSIGILKSDVE